MGSKKRILISGGGSGGHVFPAIAIAEALKAQIPDVEILFVGAKGKIEMEKVPKAGYPIKGLWISGFHRKQPLRNLLFPFKLIVSLAKAWGIVRRFKPDVVVGVGGFASGPVLEVASRMGIPTLIQEQNYLPGVTNRLLAKKVHTVCVAYDGMERFFPKGKLINTGNPVRKNLQVQGVDKAKAAEPLGLAPDKASLFIFGGSLGAKSLNEAMAANAEKLSAHPEVQVLWQAGKLYYEKFKSCATAQLPNVEIRAFVDRMDLAYAWADLVICRAGASTVAELALVGQSALLIPSPNVAEDHQTKNVEALAAQNAVTWLPDTEASEKMIDKAVGILKDERLLEQLAMQIKKLAKPNAAEAIAKEVLELAK